MWLDDVSGITIAIDCEQEWRSGSTAPLSLRCCMTTIGAALSLAVAIISTRMESVDVETHTLTAPLSLTRDKTSEQASTMTTTITTGIFSAAVCWLLFRSGLSFQVSYLRCGGVVQVRPRLG